MKGKFFSFPILLSVTLFALLVYPAAASPALLASDNVSRISSCGSTYTVRAGDTLSAIAVRCGVSLSNLMSANRLRITSIIYPGQRLVIPGMGSATTQVPAYKTSTYSTCTSPYIVRSGDTLSIIATRCGVTVYTLKQWNGLYSDLIWVGQKLYLRAVVSATPSAVATPYPYYTSGITATATPVPDIAPAVVDYLAPLPTPTPRIESPISPWW